MRDTDRSRGYIAVLNAFTGEDRYYTPRWRALLNGRSRGAGFNDAALLFGSFWFFARRMHRLGWLLLLASALLMVAGVAAVDALLGDDLPGFLPPFVTQLLLAWVGLVVVLHVPLGFVANRLYYARARRVIAAASLRAASRSELLTLVAAKGGFAIKSIATREGVTGAAGQFGLKNCATETNPTDRPGTHPKPGPDGAAP